MAFHLKLHEPVGAGGRRIVLEQIDRAVGEIDDRSLDRVEAVHQVRKRCKKIRAVLRLVHSRLGDDYASENAWFRDTARGLAHLRETDAMIATVDALRREFAKQIGGETFAAIRIALWRHRDRTGDDDTEMTEKLHDARRRLREARTRVEAWALGDGGFDAIEPGFVKTYSRGRRAMRTALKEPGEDILHEWRKRANYHRHQNRVLREIWKPVVRRVQSQAAALSELLGEDHDLAVLRHTLLDSPEQFGGSAGLESLLGVMDRRSASIRAKADAFGRRVYAEKPGALGKRYRRYWNAWRLDPADRLRGPREGSAVAAT